MQSLALLQGETGAEVRAEQRSLLDDRHKLRVNRLLKSLAELGSFGLLWALLVKERLGLGGTSRLLEQIVVNLLIDLDRGNINFCLGGNDKGLVDTLQGDPVVLVRASDEEEARRKLFEANNALSLEATSEKNQNGSRSNRRAQLGRVSFASFGALCGSRLGLFGLGNLARGTANTVKEADSTKVDLGHFYKNTMHERNGWIDGAGDDGLIKYPLV